MEIYTKVYIKMASQMALGNITGKIVPHTKEIFLQDYAKAKVYGPISKATITKDSSKMIRKTDLECSCGKMATNMKEIL